jgi:EmrB/QacA subfamily drug resistance transporter
MVNNTDLPPQRRVMILAVCCVSVLLVGIDLTAVNVALPSIGHSFHTDVSGLSWTIDAYTLTLAALLLLSASTADRIGRKHVFRIGLLIFVAGSGLCALAPNLDCLVAFRVIQAVGGSMLNPVAMAIVTNVYTKPADRARALGVWAGVIGLSLALGPILGGALVGSSLGWRWIFVINVPIGVVGVVLATRVVPESKAPRPRRVDPAGQVFVAGMLATLTYGIIEGPRLGWSSPVIVAAFVLAVAALIGILVYEPRRAQPLIELGFFKSVPFAGATLMAISSFAALSAFLFLNSLYLQDARGYSPLHAGLLTVPLAAVSIVFGPVFGKMLGKYGARPSLVVAGVGLMLTGFMLIRIDNTTATVWLLIAYAVMGIGNAAVGAPISQTAIAGMPVSQASVAAGIASTARQVGATFGVAIAGATLASTATVPPYRQLATATHIGWWLNVAYGLVILTAGLATTTRWAKATAANVANNLNDEKNDTGRDPKRPVPTTAVGPTPGNANPPINEGARQR